MKLPKLSLREQIKKQRDEKKALKEKQKSTVKAKKEEEKALKERAEAQSLRILKRLEEINSSKIKVSDYFEDAVVLEKTFEEIPRHLPQFAFGGLPKAKYDVSCIASFMDYRCTQQHRSSLRDDAESW